MTVSQPRIRRPVLLLLVYGAFLAIVGITATAQAAMVSAHFSAATLNDIVGSDAATIRAFVNAHLDGRYLGDAGPGPSAAELAILAEQLGTLTAPGEILRVEVRDPTVVSSPPALRPPAGPGRLTKPLPSRSAGPPRPRSSRSPRLTPVRLSSVRIG